MKLKYLFSLLIAILALMTSCDEEETVTLLNEIRVSKSFLAIPEEGGSETITVTAQESWEVKKKEIKVKNDEGETETMIVFDIPEWLTLSTTSGMAGETKVTFSAESAIDGRTGEVVLRLAGSKEQRINIIQGLAQISEAEVSEVKAGPDGKTFRVSGVCTSIVNTEYGNWYLTDETGDLYIYGTLDKKGGTKNFLSLNLEVGDEVTIEGPKSSYRDDPQMVNVMVIEINKSLIKVDSVENEALPIEGGEFTAYLSVKGEGVSVDIPEDAKSWLSISSIQSAGESAVVKFKATPNTGGDRGTTLKLRTTKDSKEYSTETTLSQKGAIVKATVAEFLAVEVGDIQYRLIGVITKIVNDKYGNLNLKDFSGEVYVYGIKDFQEKGLKEGDIITIVGKRAAHNENPQVAGAVLESVKPVTVATIAEVLTKPDSKEDYYMVSGEIVDVKDEYHGNVDLKDGDSEIHMRGFYPGYGAYDDYRKNFIVDKGLKVGDKITVITTKGSFGGVAQLNNGIYFSHVSAD